MKTMAEKLIGKNCQIYIWNDSMKGVIREVSDGAVMVETKNTVEAVNLDFIVRIQEIPAKK